MKSSERDASQGDSCEFILNEWRSVTFSVLDHLEQEWRSWYSSMCVQGSTTTSSQKLQSRMKEGIVVVLRGEAFMAGSIDPNSHGNLEGVLRKFMSGSSEFLWGIRSYRYVYAYCMNMWAISQTGSCPDLRQQALWLCGVSMAETGVQAYWNSICE